MRRVSPTLVWPGLHSERVVSKCSDSALIIVAVPSARNINPFVDGKRGHSATLPARKAVSVVSQSVFQDVPWVARGR